ncbi:hypothetical protein SAMN04488074_13727 [Lentzea albidocapillata subsp. violacea]|uniref:Uncharacterized protein n=1 Tax=Lentzea albidocapillata subsp. violacea TaxID=128104 RepID=A0A1G9Z7C1_9PSEU|nr:hypothetical protein [Lentzea albidocapillata]SDN16403.1 hypothetical protein SAMN04488074_13727 [Lentzea albidocapillata subsp. violacea]
MTPYEVPETVVRRFTENGCEVTAIVADPADAQQVLYGTVTRDGVLIGSYYCTDRARQSGWRVVTANGEHVASHGHTAELDHAGDAIHLLILTPSPR